MLLLLIISAVVLGLAIVAVIWRALDYARQHPELVTDGAPLAYQRCQMTLKRIIDRYQEIKNSDEIRAPVIVTWHAPNGAHYTASDQGIEQRRDSLPEARRYILPWDEIGGVGVRMQPGFTLTDRNGDGWSDSQVTTGYSFYLLIVPLSGDTMNIRIATEDRSDAVDFAAYVIALAEQQEKRINVFGFDKPPAPYRQKISRI